MKVFLVSLLLLILVAALSFAVSTQNNIEPIVYLTMPMNDETYPPDYNFQVMDVNTGEIIFELTSEDYECPYGISDDEQWLSYSIGRPSEAVYYRLNLLTMENERVEETNQQNSHLPEGATPYQAGDSLVYVTFDYDAKRFTVYWPDGQSKTFNYNHESFGIISFSNDARFIFYVGAEESYQDNALYILDTFTGEIQTLEDAEVEGRGTWHPLSNQLVYFVEIRNDNIVNNHIVLYNPLTRERQNLHRSDSLENSYVSYYWSPDARNLIIDIDHSFVYTVEAISVLNLLTNDRIYIPNFTNETFYESGVIRWINQTEFVYIATDVERHRLDEGSSDIFLYNIETQTSRNLTNTPDIIEVQLCSWG